jgi:hypothetical protein
MQADRKHGKLLILKEGILKRSRPRPARSPTGVTPVGTAGQINFEGEKP